SAAPATGRLSLRCDMSCPLTVTELPSARRSWSTSDSPLSARTPRIQPVGETARKGFRSLDLVFGRKATRVAKDRAESAEFRQVHSDSVSETPHYGPLGMPSHRTFCQAADTSPKTLLP